MLGEIAEIGLADLLRGGGGHFGQERDIARRLVIGKARAAMLEDRMGERAVGRVAGAIFEHCRGRFAYYKAPGYIAFLSEMPTTATQKIRKADLGDLAENPSRHPNCFDLRALKQQSKPRKSA